MPHSERPPGPFFLFILFAVNCLNIYDRQVLGALAEPIRREFGLSDTQIGALSTGFILVYAVAGLPLGRRADRGSRKRLLAAGLALWAGLTALGGFAANYAMLLLSRLGVAVGEAACAPAAASWIGDVFPAGKRARAMAVFMLGVPVGMALSYAAGGALAQYFGWRTALFAAALPAVALVPALLALREQPRGRVAEPAPAYSLLRIPAFRWIVISGALVNFNLYALATFLPAFLTRFHGLSIAGAGLWSGAGCGAAGAAAGLAGGVWGDRRPQGRLGAAALAAMAAAPMALGAVLVPAGNVAAAVSLMMAAYGFLNMYYGLVYAAIQDVVVPELRGSAMAVYFLAMYLCGAAFGPLLTGRLSDLLARQAAGAGPFTEAARAAGLHGALYLLPVLSLALAAALRAAQKHAGRGFALASRAVSQDTRY